MEEWKNDIYAVESETCGLRDFGETCKEGHRINWRKVCFLENEIKLEREKN